MARLRLPLLATHKGTDAAKLAKEGLPESEWGPALKPMHVTLPQDMSSAWKILGGYGGACKVSKFFCHLWGGGGWHQRVKNKFLAFLDDADPV